jgi:hypothetical protein
MTNNRQFDEHIKEQFSNYTPDVHPRVWENIIAEKDKKRPVGFWVSMFSNRNKLLILGLIIALSSGGAWLYYTKDFPVKDLLSTTDTKNHTNKNDKKPNYIASVPVTNEQTNTQSETGTPKAIEENTTNANQVLSTAGNMKSSITSPYPEAADQTAGKNLSWKRNKKPVTGLGNILVNISSPDLEEDEFMETGGTILGRLTFLGEKATEKRRTGKPAPLRFNPVLFLPDCPSFEKDAAGNKKYFEFYAGPDYAFRSFHDTANSTYLQKRKESTSFKSGYSAGIRFTRVFNNSMSVRGGINYSQVNEKFTFNQGNIVQVTYIINANGDTIGSYTTTGSRHKTTINRYRSIDIPVVVGYELGNGKFHANINAGVIVNLYSWQKGDVLDASGNPVNITTGKTSSPYQFKTNAGVGFIAATSVYYKLNDRLHIMAEPYFRYNLSQMTKTDITLKQKYHTAGLRFGIRLDLKQRQQK